MALDYPRLTTGCGVRLKPKLPDSLRLILEKQNPQKEIQGETTIIWRDGTVLRELTTGAVVELPRLPPLK